PPYTTLFRSIKKNASFDYTHSEVSQIELSTFGLDEIPESTIALLQDRMKAYKALKNTILKVNQSKYRNMESLRYMEQIRYRDSIDLLSQNRRIVYLEDQLKKLEKIERNFIPFEEFSKELKINYEAVKTISFSSVITSNFRKTDTLSVFTVKWNDSLISANEIPKKQKQLEDWLKVKYSLDSLVVKKEP